MNWLSRLKKTQIPCDMDATNATKQSFVGFVASIPATIQKTECVSAAANDPAQGVGLVADTAVAMLVASQTPVSRTAAVMLATDRWCWPHSSAMTGREIDIMVERIDLFNQRGLSEQEADLLADKLVVRDREADERRLCMECANLTGGIGAWRCAQRQRAKLGEAGLPAELVVQLQRCDGFTDQNQKRCPDQISK
jgi:hypothetical protein